MGKGKRRPRKKPRNISGLRNQPSQNPDMGADPCATSDDDNDGNHAEEESLNQELVFDSLKLNFKRDEVAEDGSDGGEDSDWVGVDSEDLGISMVKLTFQETDEEEWVPDVLKRKFERRQREGKSEFLSLVKDNHSPGPQNEDCMEKVLMSCQSLSALSAVTKRNGKIKPTSWTLLNTNYLIQPDAIPLLRPAKQAVLILKDAHVNDLHPF